MPAPICLNCPSCRRARTIFVDFTIDKITAVCTHCNPVSGWPRP